jgi:hypothetical protein
MTITSTTPTIGVSIIGSGTTGWGTITNQNFSLVDSAFSADRTRITALESINAVLPLAIVEKIGHNLIRNNIFALGDITQPNQPALNWTTQFLNGAVGNATRTNQTKLVGDYSQRISIINVDTSPSAQTRPYPGLNILDPDNLSALPNTDPRQLTYGFGYSFQPVTLLAATEYTLSCYGKSEIPNPSLGINCDWKLGIVFKSGLSVIHSFFTIPQINRTSDNSTSSFQRAELNFTTPNLPIVQAEVWLVCEGSIPAGIGSSFFAGAQLEQAVRATSLDLFSMQNGNLSVDGDLTIAGALNLQQQNLIFQSQQVTFQGNVEIGTDPNNDTLVVNTKSSIFNSPITINGDFSLGNDASNHIGTVAAHTTTFFNNQAAVNPQGGNVVIEGTLAAYGNVILGASSATNTITLNAQLVQAGNNLAALNNLTAGGSLTVARAATIGTNALGDALNIHMSSGGSKFDGYVTLNNDLFVKGNTTLGDSITDTVTINAGQTSLVGALQVTGALNVNGPSSFNMGTGNFTVVGNDFNVTATGGSVLTTPLLDVSGNLTIAEGDIASITDTITSFGTNLLPLTNFNVYSANSTYSGNLDLGGDLTLPGGIIALGSVFTLGNGLTQAFTSSSGVLTLGSSSDITSNVYNNLLTVYAGTTNFGTTGNSGSVNIKGNLQVAGNTILGSDSTVDTLSINALTLNVQVGSGNLNIGGGYVGALYNPFATDHGGITIDANGNLAMDGALTVRGPFDPTQITIQTNQDTAGDTLEALIVQTSTGTTFTLTSAGTINAKQALVLNDGYIANIRATATTFGTLSTPLQSLSVHANIISLSGITVDGYDLSTVDNISAATLDIAGSTTIGGALVVDGNITGSGTAFNFGGNFPNATTFNVRANNITLGEDGYNIGNTVVGNDLTIRHNLYVGSPIKTGSGPTSHLNDVYIRGYSINLDVGSSYGFAGPEQAGVRIGGGFLNNIYSPSVQNHGGITLDAYGNIFTDGKITTNGGIGVNNITLIAPPGSNAFDPLLTVINQSNGLQNDINLTIDAYGTVDAYGNVIVHSNLDAYGTVNTHSNINYYNTPTISGNINRSGISTGGDYDGGVASNSNRLTIPSDTTTNLNALTRKQGTIVYDTTVNELKYDTGAVLLSPLAPVGAIVAWNNGYYTNSSNAGFTAASLTLPANWSLCDGTAPNDSASPIWNTAGRFLPNINNSVFLMGSATAGSTGGAANVTLGTANLPAHTHSMNFNSGSQSADHTHTFNAGSHSHPFSGNTGTVSGGNPGGDAITEYGGPNAAVRALSYNNQPNAGNASWQNHSHSFSGTTGDTGVSGTTAGMNVSHTHVISGTTDNGPGASTAFSIIPPYLTTTYIIRIK